MKKIRALTTTLGALLLLGAAACTPEEQALWLAWHDADPEAAEAFLTPAEPDRAVRLPSPPSVDDVQQYSSWDYAATVSCDPYTLHFTNSGDVDFEKFNVQYGPHQKPLVQWPTIFSPPPLPAGESMTIDLTPSAGEVVVGFINHGMAFRIEPGGC